MKSLVLKKPKYFVEIVKPPTTILFGPEKVYYKLENNVIGKKDIFILTQIQFFDFDSKFTFSRSIVTKALAEVLIDLIKMGSYKKFNEKEWNKLLIELGDELILSSTVG